jgi:DNA polymerase
MATGDGITRMRGKWLDWRGVPVIATFHPAALLRDGTKKRDAWADLLMLKARLEGAA